MGVQITSQAAPGFRPEPAPISGVASAAARDWLETQARVVEYWRDLLADSGAGEDIVAALDAHAAFLNGVVARG